jgi:hypothetical protein
MSWDISIQKFSRRYVTISEIPNDERGVDLGPRLSVHRAISAVFPGTDWSDPAWGVWESEFGSIEFNASKDPVTGMMLHVRAGAEVVPRIVQLCLENERQGLDCSSGGFLEQAANPQQGLQAWAAYRDHVIGKKA